MGTLKKYYREIILYGIIFTIWSYLSLCEVGKIERILKALNLVK
jgi:hypothetical protein